MPRSTRAIEIRFPSGGLNRRMAYQTQPPFTVVDALNVQPDSYPSFRERGGSRPGTVPAFRTQLGSGNPVRMLAKLDIVEDTGFTYWADSFDGTSLGSVWTAGGWNGITGAPSVADGFAYQSYTTGSTKYAVTRSALSIESSNDYEINLYIAPYQAEHWGTYHIYGRMDANLSPLVNGIDAALTLSGTSGTFSGSLKTYAGSTLKNTYSFTGGSDGYAASGWFTVKVSGTTITCYWRGNTLLTQNISADSLAAGTRVGFGMDPTVASGRTQVATFRVQHDQVGENQQANRSLLCASSNGNLYVEDVMGSMGQVSTSLSLASDRKLMAQQRTQKLYIADYGDPKVSGTDGVRGTGNAKFDAASVSDWTALGIDADDDVLEISDATGDLTDGMYKISSVASGEITLTSDVADGATGTCSFRILRGPKVYDPSAGTLAIWTATANKGYVPAGQPIICLWRDRIVMAGGADSPHNWYMSRQGDPLDWDYASVDQGQAVAGNNANAGLIGEPITALMPHEDVCLWVGCYSSLWIMRGDPAYGGQIDKVSDVIGVVDKGAWCMTPDFQILFLSHDGLYRIPPGCGQQGITSVSREKIPADLLNVDANLCDVAMAYDTYRRGVHIYLTYKDERTTKHYWFDWETESFWPISLATDHEPTSILAYSSYFSEDNAVVLGGRDGYVRKFSHFDGHDDGGNTISSYLWLGPFNLAGDEALEGLITELQATLSSDSGSMSYNIYTGNHAEDAWRASSKYSGTFSIAGLNPSQNPFVRGGAAFIKVANGQNRLWSLEGLRMRVARVGEVRY